MRAPSCACLRAQRQVLVKTVQVQLVGRCPGVAPAEHADAVCSSCALQVLALQGFTGSLKPADCLHSLTVVADDDDAQQPLPLAGGESPPLPTSPPHACRRASADALAAAAEASSGVSCRGFF